MGYHNGVSTRFNPTTGSSAFPTLDPALKRGRTLQFERRVTLLSLLAGLPAVALCALLVWLGDYSTRSQLTIDLFLVLGWLVVAFKLKERIVRPLQTLSNILAALREGDYSLRGRRAAIGDALGEVMLEVNELGQTLREQRLGALEATALLRTVMSEIDVAVFAFDGKQRLRLGHRSGEKLLAQPEIRLLGRTLDEFGLAACYAHPSPANPHTLPMVFPVGSGRLTLTQAPFPKGPFSR